MSTSPTGRRAALLLFVIGTFAPGSAVAAADTADTAPPQESGLVETATVRARSEEKATAEVTVIDRDQIDALNPVSVAELIQFLTGFSLTGTGSRGGIATAQVRGGDPNFTAVLLDGVPLNDSTDVLGGAVNLNALPVALVERVEVVRGAQSSFLGSFGLAGAINIITRRGNSDRTAVDVTLGFGNASFRQGTASVSHGGEKTNWFVGANWEQEDGRVASERFEQASLQANGGTRISEFAEFRFTGRLATTEIDDYREGSGGPGYGAGLRTSENDELSVGFDLWLGRSEKRHLIRATLYRQELDRVSPAIPEGFVPSSIEHTEFNDLQLGWNLPVVLNARDSVTVGAQVRIEDGTNDSTYQLIFPPVPVDGSYDLDRATAGVYVEWLGQRGPVLIEIGARVDDPDEADTQISPRFGLAWQLENGATRLRTSVARGFKLPSFYGLASPPALGGNPDLEPEISLGADLGVEHRFARAGLTTSLTLFQTHYEDLINFSFSTFQLENVDDVRARGVEFGAGWTSPRAFTLRFNATWQDVENRDSVEELRHRPDWVLGGRYTWEFAGKFRWDFDGQWQSSMRDEQIPVPDRDTVASWSAFGTALAMQVTTAWELRVRLDNVFDQEYETLIGFPAADRSARVDLRCKARSFVKQKRALP